MKKQLRILTPLIFLSLSAFLWIGCLRFHPHGVACNETFMYSESAPMGFSAESGMIMGESTFSQSQSQSMYTSEFSNSGPIYAYTNTSVTDPALAKSVNSAEYSLSGNGQPIQASVSTSVKNPASIRSASVSRVENAQALQTYASTSMKNPASTRSASTFVSSKAENSQPIMASVTTSVNNSASTEFASSSTNSQAENAQPIQASVSTSVKNAAATKTASASVNSKAENAQPIQASVSTSVKNPAATKTASVSANSKAENAQPIQASVSTSVKNSAATKSMSGSTNSMEGNAQTLAAANSTSVKGAAISLNESGQPLSASTSTSVKDAASSRNVKSPSSSEGNAQTLTAANSTSVKGAAISMTDGGQALSASAPTSVNDAASSRNMKGSASSSTPGNGQNLYAAASTPANQPAYSQQGDASGNSRMGNAPANQPTYSQQGDASGNSRMGNAPANQPAYSQQGNASGNSRMGNAPVNQPAYAQQGNASGNSRMGNAPAYQEGTANNANADAAKGCQFGPSCEMSTGVVVRAKNPKMCLKGASYTIDVEVTAYADVHDVVLTATLPENATYVSSQPEAKVSRRELTWSFDRLNKGQTVVGKITLKSEKEGELCTCFNVRAAADACCSILCAKPVLSADKTGPEEVTLGDQINYTVTVGNTGSYPAEDVVLVLTDVIDNKKPVNFRLGTLAIGQSKKIDYAVTATKRGKVAYSAVATSSNADQASCDLATLVTCYAVECRKEGTKETIIGQNANYQINVVNTGDKTLHDVVIADTVHPGTTIVAAQGAEINGKKAVWTLKELKAGEKVAFNQILNSRNVGNYTSNVVVTNKQGYTTGSEATTRWKGRAALDVSMSTSDNSLLSGDTSRYKISVTNQGQEPDSNVVVAVIFPTGLEPLDTSGAAGANINGQTVTFAPFAVLAPRQTLEYYVMVKANVRGDLRPKIQVSSDSIKTPITQEESLIVN